jgi:hypothetical protein
VGNGIVEEVAMKESAVFLAGMLCLFFIGCDGDSRCTVCPDGAESWYFNSFESGGDAVGWEGITEAMFVDDPAPGCGDQSLFVTGGCVLPTYRLVFPPSEVVGDYVLSCWAKRPGDQPGGWIDLATYDDEGERDAIQLWANNDEWTFHRTDHSLHCPSGVSLVLELQVGGFGGGAAYFDCIKIERLE